MFYNCNDNFKFSILDDSPIIQLYFFLCTCYFFLAYQLHSNYYILGGRQKKEAMNVDVSICAGKNY